MKSNHLIAWTAAALHETVFWLVAFVLCGLQ
jgi:hypothetical protein